MATSFDVGLLEPLLIRAEETHSDAVVVMHQGELVSVWRFGKPKQLIQTMSVTKSIVNLAIGKLVTDGLLPSIDELICTLYPEWKQGRKRNITIRHIMNHRSGLQNVPNASEEINSSPDYVQLALCAELDDEPGSRLSYNNKAVNILAGIVERISYKKLDEYMKDTIFTPLGITEFFWGKDPAGNPGVLAGLMVFPEDLAKLGQLVLSRGEWAGQQIIEPTWFDLINSQSGEVGLLWWLVRDGIVTVNDNHIANLRAADLPEEMMNKFTTLRGTHQNTFMSAFQKMFGETWWETQEILKSVNYGDVTFGDIYGYMANGYLGQNLYIFPDQQLVVVRMISYPSFQMEEDGFTDFREIVIKLAKSL